MPTPDQTRNRQYVDEVLAQQADVGLLAAITEDAANTMTVHDGLQIPEPVMYDPLVTTLDEAATSDINVIHDEFQITPPSFSIRNAQVIEATNNYRHTFEIQQNTQEREIRELRTEYPHDITHTDFQRIVPHVFGYGRREIRDAIRQIRQLEFAEFLHENVPPKQRKNLSSFIGAGVNDTVCQLEELENDYIEARKNSLKNVFNRRLAAYTLEKRTFLEQKIRLAPLQARFNQQVSLIRQKPSVHRVIDLEEVVNTLKTWDNVFAAHAMKDPDDYRNLFIRVGLCDIVMSESAIETEYDRPVDIKLAPMLFTIRLDHEGRFAVRSQEGNTMGLSRDRLGRLYYDCHPHQLHDTPCFGSFGQTLIDLANCGDMIGLISGIIAFYSQYNSADSAGVAARYFHPMRISGIGEPTEYINALVEAFDVGAPAYFVNEEKLVEAVDRYQEYYRNPPEEAPEIACTHVCVHCDEENVSDGRDYYIAASGDRICSPCWHDSYCGDCEQYHEDCTCNDDDPF
jgi:hypothetical protein